LDAQGTQIDRPHRAGMCAPQRIEKTLLRHAGGLFASLESRDSLSLRSIGRRREGERCKEGEAPQQGADRASHVPLFISRWTLLPTKHFTGGRHVR